MPVVCHVVAQKPLCDGIRWAACFAAALQVYSLWEGCCFSDDLKYFSNSFSGFGGFEFVFFFLFPFVI